MPKARRSRAGGQRKLKTMFVRVPARDWSRVTNGRQREFRVAVGGLAAAYGFDNVTLPLPLFVVAYRTHPQQQKLMVLEAVRQERLIEITEDGLAAAGYSGPWDEAFPRFRRDWTIGEKKHFEPSRKVVVFTVRLAREDDIDTIGRNLVHHLYGDHLASQE